MDKETGTVKITLGITNPPASIRPGSYIHLRIVTRTRMVDTTLPKKALIYDGRQQTFVFVASPDDTEPSALFRQETSGSDRNGRG